MILADSSAWIEFFRATGSPAHRRLHQILDDGEELGTTEPVIMEVLAGARDERHQRALEAALASAQLLPVGGVDVWLGAADLYRIGRRQGVTVRSSIDCLIAAVAIRAEIPVLHHDRDFDALARFSPLQLAT